MTEAHSSLRSNDTRPSPFTYLRFYRLFTGCQAKLKVVATLPDFAALAREIGGDKVEVTTLAKPTEDPHFVDARPSFVVELRNADVLIEAARNWKSAGCRRFCKTRAIQRSKLANRDASRRRKEFA